MIYESIWILSIFAYSKSFCIVHILKRVKKDNPEDLKLLGREDLEIPKLPFPRLTYAETVDMLKKAGEIIEFGDDFTKMQEKKLVAIGYEIIQDECGEFPVMKAISELVGHMLPSIAGRYLSFFEGGRGVALANLPGIPPASAAIVGAGNVRTTAAKAFTALGVQTHLFDISVPNLRRAEAAASAVITHMAERLTLERACTYTDVLITAAYVHGDRPPTLITEDMVRSMKPRTVVMDIAIDQGGCVETSRPTTHHEPTFIVDISAQFERKMQAILAYSTQFRPDDASYEQTVLTSPEYHWMLRARMGRYGSLIGVQYGEGFLIRGRLQVENPLQAVFFSF